MDWCEPRLTKEVELVRGVQARAQKDEGPNRYSQHWIEGEGGFCEDAARLDG